jgi:hypothetical protein
VLTNFGNRTTDQTEETMSSGIKPNGSCRKLKLPQKKSRTIFEQPPQVSTVFNACASRVLVVGNYGVVATKPKSAVTFYVNGVARFTFFGSEDPFDRSNKLITR